MVEIAAARLPGARVVQGEAVPLPFEDRAFERVFTSHFYGHLLADERQAFRAEAQRVAGELVVVDSALREGVEAEQYQPRSWTTARATRSTSASSAARPRRGARRPRGPPGRPLVRGRPGS